MPTKKVSVKDLQRAKIRDEFHLDSADGLLTVRFIRPTKFLIANPGRERIIRFESIEEAANKLYRSK